MATESIKNRTMDEAWKQAISEGLKRANLGLNSGLNASKTTLKSGLENVSALKNNLVKNASIPKPAEMKVKVQDVLKKAEDGIKKKGFLSFIANAFVLKNTNPSSPNKPVRTYKIEYARIPQKSFFNLIWKTILEGMMMTVKGK